MTFFSFFRSVNGSLRSNGESSRDTKGHFSLVCGLSRAAASCGTKACAHREIASTGGRSAQKGTPSNRGMVGHDDAKSVAPRGTNVSSPRPATQTYSATQGLPARSPLSDAGPDYPGGGRGQCVDAASSQASPVVTGLPPTADPYGTESTASRASTALGARRGRPLTTDEMRAYSALYPSRRERVNIP